MCGFNRIYRKQRLGSLQLNDGLNLWYSQLIRPSFHPCATIIVAEFEFSYFGHTLGAKIQPAMAEHRLLLSWDFRRFWCGEKYDIKCSRIIIDVCKWYDKVRGGRLSRTHCGNTHLRGRCIQRTVIHKQNAFKITSRGVQGWTSIDFRLKYFFT